MQRLSAAGVLLFVLLTSCGGGTEPNTIDVGTIVVSPNPVTLMQQETAQLDVSVLDPDGALLSGVAVTFSSADPAIVTVSNTGLITSVGPAGSTTVSVKAGNKTSSLPVTVSVTSTSITLGPATSEIPQLGTLQLEPRLLDVLGQDVPGATFTFESIYTDIAQVDANGLVTSLGPAGTAQIVVRSGEFSTGKTITVTPVPTAVRVNPMEINVPRSGSLQIFAVVVDAVGEPLQGFPISFEAAPGSLVSISPSGLLTAMDQEGTGMVTATSGNLSSTVPVNVLDLGQLRGILAGRAMVGRSAYGVAISSTGEVFGVEVEGRLYKGVFGSPTMTEYALSDIVTIGVAVASDGSVFVTGAPAHGLMEVDPASGTMLRNWSNSDQFYDVALSPDEQTIYVAGSNGVVEAVDRTTFLPVNEYNLDGSVVHLLHHPTLPLLYVSGVGRALELNTGTGAVRQFQVGGSAQASALAIAGDRLFVGQEGGSIDVISLSTGAVSTVPGSDCLIYDLVATPDGKALLMSCGYAGSVMLLDTQKLSARIIVPTGGVPRRIAISPDGTWAVIANQSGWFEFMQ